ncbi:MAG TPA: 2-hydroxyacid dehydrogenase [Xanthobacteraceae bacterium]|jgi:lactate dehydrogenase-like 2-hydroxyacid dehydrogenase
MKPDLLYIGRFPEPTVEELHRRFTVHNWLLQPKPEDIDPALRARVRVAAVEVNRGANRALIEALPKLELIACFGSGVDLVDVPAARERGIPVTNTPAVFGDECADLAIGLMLASCRQIIYADHYVRSGEWKRKGPISLGRNITGKTVGIVGLGAIGRAIADRAVAFKMQVLYTGPRRKPDAPYEFVPDLIELARRSDVLMVAALGAPETRHLISAEVIDALGPKGLLINVARGFVVDEAAMIRALQEGRLGWAALDVFDSPPGEPDPALLALPNVIVQPHHGSATLETRSRIGQHLLANLDAWLMGKPLVSPVG